jgi:integrase
MASITKRTVERLKPQAKDYFLWDDDLAGFGVRVMRSGFKSYVVQYRVGGRTRRNAFSRIGTMTPDEARKHARGLLVEVDKGGDPVAELVERRRSPTLRHLCERFLTEYVDHRCKPTTQRDYHSLVRRFIIPRFGTFKISDIKRPDVAKLHHDLRETPYQANRTLATLSKIFNLAEIWGLRPDGSNPCRHVRKYRETKRERYLTFDEIKALGQVLAEAERDGSEPQPVINAVRLLMLTGARLTEIQTLKWEHVRDRVLVLPDSKTGAKRIVLGKEAADLLSGIKKLPDNPYVITGKVKGRHWNDLERPWRRMRAKADLPDLRIHDLRHSFASFAAGAGESLPMIGKLLGHSQAQTTARYAHLAPDPVSDMADRMTALIASAMTPEMPKSRAANANEPLTHIAAE